MMVCGVSASLKPTGYIRFSIMFEYGASTPVITKSAKEFISSERYFKRNSRSSGLRKSLVASACLAQTYEPLLHKVETTTPPSHEILSAAIIADQQSCQISFRT
jgi:hypothetical protein